MYTERGKAYAARTQYRISAEGIKYGMDVATLALNNIVDVDVQ